METGKAVGMAGRLTLCGTPIGNLEDASPRLLRTLSEADCVACEDPRRAKKLFSHFDIRARDLVVYNEGNERRAARDLVGRLKRGESVALISDAGIPGLSDPGYRLVAACVAEDIDVSIVPGPSAAIAALAVSGLPPNRFVFEGFLPRKPGDRAERVRELGSERRTLLFYVSPHRLAETLEVLIEGLGDRRAALVRELTKMFEDKRRGSLSELLDAARADPPKGELVLVVEGARPEREAIEPAELARRARSLMDEGIDRKEAMARVARDTGVPKREVFDALVAEKAG